MHELVLPEEYLLLEGEAPGYRVVLIGSEAMGSGDEGLGRKLMLSFLGEIASGPTLPHVVILYNGGISLVAPGSLAAEDLHALEKHGAEILACRDSLEFHGIPTPLPTGRPASMAEIADCLMKASVVIRL
jgi:intracellular sulfur oxidation DsrE/DsrF family protein